MMKTFIRQTVILGAVFGLASGLWAQKPDPFEEKFTYYNNRQLGERLVVSFPRADSELAKSVEMIVFDEAYYDETQGAYSKRQVAIFAGMGMGSSGLKIVLNDHSQRNKLTSVLDRFVKTYDAFIANQKEILESHQDWMGDGWQAIAVPRNLGSIYFYPNKKEMVSTFNFDLEVGRIWLNMGSRVFMDQEVVPYVLRMVNQIPVYQDKLVSLRNDLGKTNEQIDGMIGADRARARL